MVPEPLVGLLVPELGLSSDEPWFVSCWLVREGDTLIEGDRLVELLSGEILFEVASPTNGTLARIVREPDEQVAAGALLGWIVPSAS